MSNLPTWCTGNEPDNPVNQERENCPVCGEFCYLESDEDGYHYLHPSTENYNCPEND